MKIKILWVVKIGEEDWQEQLIVDTTSASRLADAKAWAIKNGFDRLRVSLMTDGEKPDFSKVLNT